MMYLTHIWSKYDKYAVYGVIWVFGVSIYNGVWCLSVMFIWCVQKMEVIVIVQAVIIRVYRLFLFHVNVFTLKSTYNRVLYIFFLNHDLVFFSISKLSLYLIATALEILIYFGLRGSRLFPNIAVIAIWTFLIVLIFLLLRKKSTSNWRKIDRQTRTIASLQNNLR